MDDTPPGRTLTRFAATLEHDDIPAEVAAHARLVVADTVGAMLGGATTDPVAAFVQHTCDRTAGTTPIVGHNATTTPHLAAFANGTAATVLELDEGHKFAAGHPASHVLPALLAEPGPEVAVDGDRFLTSFVAGYEVAARVGRACYPLADGYHPHGVWGPVGAAVAVARYRGYEPVAVDHAARIAAEDAQHTLMATATEGATVRDAFAGGANLSGLLAADLAAAGFSGTDRGIERHLSLATADGVEADEFTAELGTRWDVTLGYFKRHAACRYTHPALDALEDLPIDDLAPADIERVRVETYPAAAELSDSRPATGLQARFSIPFAVATRLTHGTSGKVAFVESAIDAETLALAERVTVEATAEFDAAVPDERSARVTVRTTDAREHSHVVTHAKGGAERPYEEAEIYEKFRELATPVLGESQAAALWQAAREAPIDPGAVRDLARPE